MNGVAKAPQRLVWSEGLLMAPQHLQQLDIYHERLLSLRLDAVSHLNWGVLSAEFDRRVLGAGQIQLTRFRGVLPDGSVLELEAGDPELPAMRLVGEHFPHTQRTLEVFLAIPREREGVDNFDPKGQGPVRYRVAKRSVRDMTAPARSAELCFGQRNVALLFGDELINDFVALKLAEIVRDDSGGLVFSELYVPPCLRIDASAFLQAGLRRLLQTMITRHHALSEARRQNSAAAVEFAAIDVTRYLLLNTINTFLPVLHHMVDSSDLPPRTVYLTLIQLAGQLCTFSTDADPARLPKFVYTDLGGTFEELFARITALLLATVSEHFVAIPLSSEDDGMYRGKLDDERLPRCDRFLISVKTDLPERQVASQLPRLAKVASSEDIHGIQSAATPGAALQVAYRPPPEIPIKAGLVYFSIALDNPYWRKIISERAIAVYLPPFFDPGCTEVELLAIPRRPTPGA